MSDLVDGYPRSLVSAADDLAQEFEARLRDSGTLAFRVAYGVLRHRQDAEDVAQEAFVRAHRSFSQLRDRERFRAWLVRAAWRLALDHRRGSLRRTTREESVAPSPQPSVEELAVDNERATHLWNAIDGHDTREVSALLTIPEGTVRSRLFLARKALAERLQWLTTHP